MISVHIKPSHSLYVSVSSQLWELDWILFLWWFIRYQIHWFIGYAGFLVRNFTFWLLNIPDGRSISLLLFICLCTISVSYHSNLMLLLNDCMVVYFREGNCWILVAVHFLWVKMAVFTLSLPAARSQGSLCAQPPMLLDTAPERSSWLSTVRAAWSMDSSIYVSSLNCKICPILPVKGINHNKITQRGSHHFKMHVNQVNTAQICSRWPLWLVTTESLMFYTIQQYTIAYCALYPTLFYHITVFIFFFFFCELWNCMFCVCLSMSPLSLQFTGMNVCECVQWGPDQAVVVEQGDRVIQMSCWRCL